MQYIEASEIIRQPHVSFPADELARVGFEDMAIKLLRYLPYLDVDCEISRSTTPFNYLAGVDDARECYTKMKTILRPG
jgi:hypothetical protein